MSEGKKTITYLKKKKQLLFFFPFCLGGWSDGNISVSVKRGTAGQINPLENKSLYIVLFLIAVNNLHLGCNASPNKELQTS